MRCASNLLALAPIAAFALLQAACGTTVTQSQGTSATTTSAATTGTGGSGQGGGAAGSGGKTTTTTTTSTTSGTECTPDDCESIPFICCDDATGAQSLPVCDPPVCQMGCRAGSREVPFDPHNGPGVCPVQFACGTTACEHGKEYCRHSVSDVGGQPDSYGCVPLPAGCGDAPTCDCAKDEPCGFLCKASDAGDLTLTCPGG
jgi:hypothetical protein